MRRSTIALLLALVLGILILTAMVVEFPHFRRRVLAAELEYVIRNPERMPGGGFNDDFIREREVIDRVIRYRAESIVVPKLDSMAADSNSFLRARALMSLEQLANTSPDALALLRKMESDFSQQKDVREYATYILTHRQKHH